MTTENMFGDLVYSYTRKQAIADGTLVDLTPFGITREHWKMPLACSATVWSAIETAVQDGKDLQGILHDIYTLAKLSIKPNSPATQDRIYFKVIVGSEVMDLILHCGPGDDPVPVLTLMTPHDD